MTPVVRVIVDPAGTVTEPREVDLSTTPGVTIVSTDFVYPVVEPA